MDCGGPGSFCRGFKAPISESFATPCFLDDEDRSSRNSERTAAGKDSCGLHVGARGTLWVSRSACKGIVEAEDPCRGGLLQRLPNSSFQFGVGHRFAAAAQSFSCNQKVSQLQSGKQRRAGSNPDRSPHAQIE